MDVILPGWASPAEEADLARKLAACERLIELSSQFSNKELPLRKAVSGPPDPDSRVLPMAVYEEFGRTVKTFRACVHLASMGYGQAAHMLSAVVVQSGLIVVWSADQGESVDAKAELHSRYVRQLDLDQRRSVGLWKSLSEEERLSDEDLATATATFGANGMGLWTGHASLAELVEDLAVDDENDDFARRNLQQLKIIADYATAIILGTGLANQYYRTLTVLPDGREALAVNIGPGAEACAAALHTAVAGFLPALDAMVTGFAPDLADQLRECEGLLWRAWKDPALLVALDDGDPCPCDKPGTVWGQCHKWTSRIGKAYLPFTDDDLVNFTPWDPQTHQPPDFDLISEHTPDAPEGPAILTYTFRLPFPLGLADSGGNNLFLQESWADPNDVAHFGRTPVVRVRVHNEATDGLDLWPNRAPSALRHFYGSTESSDEEMHFTPIPDAYEQWVSLETPNGRLESENPDDGAYAFHRALLAFNSFLTALDLAVSDPRVTSVSTHEIGPMVFRGASKPDGTWTRLSDLLMHMDSYPFSVKPESLESLRGQIGNSLEDLRNGRPFILASLWHGRAIRAHRYRGDNADCIFSLQTAAESMFYDLLNSMLVDLGKSSAQIDAKVNSDLPFRSLLTKEIPPLLGGNWNLNGDGPVGRYWQATYLVRNRVVHSGYSATNMEAEAAMESFLQVREYISELLQRRISRYPRTLLAKIGENGLVRRGWMSQQMTAKCAELLHEPRPFYWPRDVAGR